MIPSRRNAFTLLEACVAAAVFAGVLGLVWSLTLLGRRGDRASDRDAGVEAMLLAQERLEADLALLASTGTRPDLDVLPTRDGITFAYRAPGASTPATVAYGFETIDGRPTFVRVENGKRAPVGGGHIGAARFELKWTPVGWMLRTALDYTAEGQKLGRDHQTSLFLTRLAPRS